MGSIHITLEWTPGIKNIENCTLLSIVSIHYEASVCMFCLFVIHFWCPKSNSVTTTTYHNQSVTFWFQDFCKLVEGLGFSFGNLVLEKSLGFRKFALGKSLSFDFRKFGSKKSRFWKIWSRKKSRFPNRWSQKQIKQNGKKKTDLSLIIHWSCS